MYSARASVANLAPATTPGYVVRFDTKLALTNSPIYVPANDTVDMYSATTTNRITVNGGGYLNTVTNSGSQTLSLFSGSTASTLNLFGGGGSRIVADAGNNYVALYGYMTPSSGFAINPTAPAGNVPFLFNSLTNHPGDFIFEVDYAGGAQLKVKQNSGYAGGGTKALTDDGTYKTFGTGSASVNPTSTFVPYNNAGSFADSWWYYTANGMGTDKGIFFGAGVTNLLERNGQDLWYVLNDAATAGFQVKNTNGTARMQISSDGLTGAFQGGTGLAVFGLSSGASGIMAGSGYVVPLTAGLRLGSGGTPWGDGNFKGVFYEWAAGTDTINYSRLAISQPSTNDPVTFDIQTGGTAGYARSFALKTNGVEVFRIPGSSIWDDSMVPEALVRVGASAPSQANFNGGPGQTLQFQNNRDDAILASVQLSHRYKQGTDLYPHVHWAETATTGAGTGVVWELQYTIANPMTGTYGAYTTISTTTAVSGTNWKHSMTTLPAISGTGLKVSAIMVFQLRRLANSAAADDYDQNVAFLGFDLHYQVDSPGSDSTASKSF